ncbi:Oidioi.mRNA.OKI2018_I69.chr2.g4970.t1.cds [Oikopleura dioica]|uniref:Oidioi.mRNA.OKI2018_I69.chr2.g4970.t1.cds n=1 Tax=Oikopleura dioica TaxID=34765 RepID=A0ABN7T847_OIKDI|nr:Oidioi.mRNA.OKI2018_I69.chr2.g4970.t1.cds [Oikopleura dioica]
MYVTNNFTKITNNTGPSLTAIFVASALTSAASSYVTSNIANGKIELLEKVIDDLTLMNTNLLEELRESSQAIARLTLQNSLFFQSLNIMIIVLSYHLTNVYDGF